MMSPANHTDDKSPLPSLLVVDDDASQRGLLKSFLTLQGFPVTTASSGEEALDLLRRHDFQMMISDVRMPGLSGLETLKHARIEHSELPVLLVTAYADIRDAVSAMRDGAVNYLEKPIDLDELLVSVRNGCGLRGTCRTAIPDTLALPEDIVAESPQMRAVLREVALAAPSDARVLITGESGVGKEVVADLTHAWGPRSARPLVKVNCAAIPEALLESELFGHEKGAFTGAVGTRIGRFEEAAGGTVLLDEVGDMHPALQSKLLRFTEDGSFQRVGSNQERKADVRVLAATNKDIEADVAAGRFREDLFYRLNVLEIHIAPLRDRPTDIIPLANLFAARFATGKARISVAATTCMELYGWPGNVREVRNALERACLMARGEIILPEHLPRRIKDIGDSGPDPTQQESGRRMADVERTLILRTLQEHSFNRTETAHSLGISRRALLYKVQTYREQGYPVDSP